MEGGRGPLRDERSTGPHGEQEIIFHLNTRACAHTNPDLEWQKFFQKDNRLRVLNRQQRRNAARPRVRYFLRKASKNFGQTDRHIEFVSVSLFPSSSLCPLPSNGHHAIQYSPSSLASVAAVLRSFAPFLFRKWRKEERTESSIRKKWINTRIMERGGGGDSTLIDAVAPPSSH